MYLAIGLFFALTSWLHLSIGGAYPMGPGFFPFCLSSILCIFGVGILVSAFGKEPSAIGAIPWRGLVMVFASILFFALTVTGLGMLPALAGCTFLAAIAPNDADWKSATILTVALTVFCLVIFIYALRLPYPVIGPWLMSR
jgi:hypothetical protein